jgi:NADH-quinone oxidoreductase subunit N
MFSKKKIQNTMHWNIDTFREQSWVGDFWNWKSIDYILEYSTLTQTSNIYYFLPYAIYFSFLLFILCISLLINTNSKYISVSIQGLTSLITLLILFLFLSVFSSSDFIFRPVLLFNRALLLNYFTSAISSYILFFTLLFLLGSWNFFFSKKNKLDTFIEYPILIGFSIFFLLALISSYDLMVVYLTLEGLSILLYVLAAYPFRQSSLEASIKYYSLGALSSGILLFGISLIYGIIGGVDFLNIKFFFAFNENIPFLTINFTILCLIFGFLFKISAFPCHMWAPDVYEGTWLPTTIFLMVIVKMALFFFFLRFLIYLFYNIFFICQTILLVSSLGSIILGSFGSLYQQGIKRLLSYTSISQVGFALLGLACGTPAGIISSILFFIAYIVASLGVFIILINIESYCKDGNIIYISELTNFSNWNRSGALVLTIFILSMAGIPPLAGFFGKLSIFLATIGAHMYIFTLIAIFLSTVNAYTYIRIIKILWSDHIIFGTENFKLYDYFFMFTISESTKSKTILIYKSMVKYILRLLLLHITTMYFFFTWHLSWCRALLYSMVTINANLIL